MSNYEDLKDSLRPLECPTCLGHAEIDDTESGDIPFNIYKCSDCEGTGFKDGQEYVLSMVVKSTITNVTLGDTL